MGDGVVYRVTGDREVARALADVADDLDGHGAMQHVADDADRVVTGVVPKVTGGLAHSVRAVGAAHGYAAVTLLKRRNIHASSFIREADQQLQTRAAQVLEDDINRNIRQEGLR